MPDGYDIWAVDGKPVSVHLRDSAASQLRGLASQPHEASGEAGGILWGRVRDAGEDVYLVAVESVEVVETDPKQLKARLRKKHGDLQPVGFWRLHHRQGLYLDQHDLELMASCFPNPWSVALCVRPPATAGFFFWEQGSIHRTSSYREFELPDAGQPEDIPLPAPPRRWPTWAVGFALVLALSLFPLFQVLSPRLAGRREEKESAFNRFSMRAENHSGNIRLTWNPRSRMLRDANGAILWILDGADESKLELSQDLVRVGALEYKPTGSDVNFRMQVGEFSESLRVSPPRERAVILSPIEPPTAPASLPENIPENIPERATRERIPDPPEPMVETRVSTSVEVPKSSALKRAFGWVGFWSSSDVIPARPVRQVRPRISGKPNTTVSVLVSIDQYGAVGDTALLTKNLGADLERSVVEAARQWRFQPARIRGRAVGSNMVVNFRFAVAGDRG